MSQQNNAPIASSLLSPRHLYEGPPGVYNFTGLVYSLTVPVFPIQPTTIPVISTWYNVYKPFEMTLRFINPSGQVENTYSQTIEPSNDWGYKFVSSPIEIGPTIPGIYTLEVWADNVIKLSRTLGFFQEGVSVGGQLPNEPEITGFIGAELVNSIEKTDQELDIKNIMTDEGFHRNGSFAFLLEFKNCIKLVRFRLDLITPEKKSLVSLKGETQTGPIKVLNDTYKRVRINYEVPRNTFKQGVYWVQITYKNKIEQFPFLLK